MSILMHWVDFFRKWRLLCSSGVKNLYGMLMYVCVHSGPVQIFSMLEDKIRCLRKKSGNFL